MSGESNVRDGAAADAFLEIDDVSVSYAGRKALQNVSLSASLGEILVLLGPNGAGKSTLIKTICGRMHRRSGRVQIAGRDPARQSDARRAVGIVPQQIALFERLTARENLVTFGRLMGLSARAARQRADLLLERVELGDRARDLVAALSGGMRRRINIAAGLVHSPQLLILDEPTAGLDAASKQGLVDLLRDLKKDGLTILLTTHDMDEADALADRVAILVAGRLRSLGPVRDLVAAQFGTAKEIKLILKPAAVGDPLLREAVDELERARLTPGDGGRTWTGLIDGAPESLGVLLGSTGPVGSLVERVGVRQPGLEALLRVEISHAQAEAA